VRRLFLFMNVSVDGYVEAPGHDLSWSQTHFEAFSPEGSREVDTILLGHKTYELMKAFWPTPQAAQVQPEVARFMNERRKVVASHAPFEPGWQNVTVIHGDVAAAVSELKAQPGGDIIILGSNNLCVTLLQEGLLDELQLVVNPIALGAGTSLVAGLAKRVRLKLAATRLFPSGSILLVFEPEE
jgi:dihydrofolate reductase